MAGLVLLLVATVTCFAAVKRPSAPPAMTACSVTFRCGVCYGITTASWTGNPTPEITVKCVHCMTPWHVGIH